MSSAASHLQVIDSAKFRHSATSLKTRLSAYLYTAPSLQVNKQDMISSQSVLNKSRNMPTKKSTRKRAAEQMHEEDDLHAGPKKKKRTTTEQRAAADPYNPTNNLTDSLRPNLHLVFIGLNPGLMTAATGHAYAHPSNMFWKLLHWSGITAVRHNPSETHDLMDLYSIGNTNICKRPTRSGNGLAKEELVEGAGILENKIRDVKPEVVCIVGKGIWDTIYKVKTGKVLKSSGFEYGWQDEQLWLGRETNEDGTVRSAGSKTFVATTTSGLAAGMTPQQKLEVWKPLGEWMQERRGVSVKKEERVENPSIKSEQGD